LDILTSSGETPCALFRYSSAGIQLLPSAYSSASPLSIDT